MNTNKLVVAILLFFTCSTSAQTSWQWGKIGGSRYSVDAGSNPVSEWIISMAADPGGNTYALVRGANRIYAAPDSSSTTTSGFALISWACDGHVRWLKTIGAYYPGRLATDTLGGLYMMGGLDYYSGGYFDVDTVIAPQNVYRRNYIMKYDTAGHLKWLRFPDPNLQIANYANWPHFSQLQVAPNGDVHILAYLSAGSYADNAYTVSGNAYHVMKYDKNGTFTSGIRLPVTTPLDVNGMPAVYTLDDGRFLRDPANGRYYLAGTMTPPYYYTNLYIGNDTIRTSALSGIFVAAIDATGGLKWLKKQDTTSWGNVQDATLDHHGNIYLGGQIANNKQFNGSTFSIPSGTSMAYMVSLDSNGVNRWTSVGYSPLNETPLVSCMAVNKDNVLRIAGYAANKFKWGNFSMSEDQPAGSLIANTGMYSVTLDPATGIATGLDSLRNKRGFGTSPQFMASDKNGNFFISGMLQNEHEVIDTMLTVGPSKLVAIGGSTDFFMLKYGTASCKAPVITAVNTVSGNAAWHVYPNPVSDNITISGMDAIVEYTICNSLGSKLQTGSLSGRSSTININSLPPGLYYLQVATHDGNGKVFKFLKN